MDDRQVPVGRVALVAALALLLGAVVLAAPADALTGRAPIVIVGNAGFTAANGTVGGSGTAADPYVIEGWDIAATGATGISIKGTTAYVVVRDSRIANGGSSYDGIRLESVRNAVVEGNVLEGNRNGIVLADADGATVQENLVNSTSSGLVLEGTTGATIASNRLPHNAKDVSLASSTGNTFTSNDLSIASGQYGFFFQDTNSYDNAIATSNTVNDVAVRWYTRATGLDLPDLEVGLKGITNVAQIMVYRSSDVTLDSPVARDGAARGIVVWDSDDVEVLDAVVKGNAGDGVRLASSRDVLFHGGNVSLNGDAGFRVNDEVGTGSSGTTIAWANVTENKGRGFSVESAADDVVIERSLVLGNGVHGVFASEAGDLALRSSTIRANDDAGVEVRKARAGSAVEIESNVVDRNAKTGILVAEIGTSVPEVAWNTVADNGPDGIFLDTAKVGDKYPRSGTVWGNAVRDHTRNVVLRAFNGTFSWNNVTIDDGEWGFWLHDEPSYYSTFATNNEVDDVPLRFYTWTCGTSSSPLALSGVEVELEGITNVGQIVFYGCSHVTLDAPRAANGTADGILVRKSSYVEISDAVVRDNAGSGIRIHAGSTADTVPSTGGGLFGRVSASYNEVVDSVVEDNGGASTDDAGIRIEGLLATANGVRRNEIDGNAPAGIRVKTVGSQTEVVGNNVTGSADGIVLHGATLAQVRSNRVEGAEKGFVLTTSTANVLDANVVEKDGEDTGLWFSDEQSYSNQVRATNTVDGQAVRWYTYTNTGNATTMTLSPVAAGVPRMTNVAQIMLYKVEHVALDGAYAGNGTAAGVLVHKSAFVEISNATVEDSPTAVLLESTQSSTVRDGVLVGGQVGVHLKSSDANVVEGVTTRLTSQAAVKVTASSSNRVHAVDVVSTSGGSSVDDGTFVAGNPSSGSNLVVDAGVPKRVLTGTLVTFSDAKAVSPFSNERVLTQTWDFGDGVTRTQSNANVFRPTKGYNGTGSYDVELTVTTTGATYTDAVRVDVVAALQRPDRLQADLNKKTVDLSWRAAQGGLGPVTAYKVWRGVDGGAQALAATLANVTEWTDNVSAGKKYVYAVSAVNAEGESERSKNLTVEVPAGPLMLPGAPTALRANSTVGREVVLTWTAPTSGGPFTFVVHRGEDAANASLLATTRNVTFTDLVPEGGREYAYRVAATNATGTGAFSAFAYVDVAAVDVTFSHPAPAPGAVVLPVPVVGLSFEAPAGTTWRMTIDGAIVQAARNGTRLEFVPFVALAAGNRTAEVVVLEGNVTLDRETWTFEVRHPEVECPDRLQAVEGERTEFTCTVTYDGEPGEFDLAIRRLEARVGGALVSLGPNSSVEVDLAYTAGFAGNETLDVGSAKVLVIVAPAAAPPQETEESPVAWIAAPAAFALAAWVWRRRA